MSSDDGRRGVLSGDAIVSGRRHAIEPVIPHAGVIIGNRSSVIVGPSVLVSKGVGAVPLEHDALLRQEQDRLPRYRAVERHLLEGLPSLEEPLQAARIHDRGQGARRGARLRKG